MIKKIVSVVVCLTAIINQAGAQGLGIVLKGGLQGMKYDVPNGQNKLLPGGSLGVNYTFRLSSQWGLLTGITGGIFRTEVILQDGVVFSSAQVDDAGSAFQYNVKAAGYKETQRFFAASFPVMLQYHTSGTGTQWYFDAGVNVLVPFSNSVQISAQRLTLSGFYPDYNLDVSNLPQHGFGTVDGWKVSTTSKLRPGAALSAAIGISFALSSDTRIYTGAYIDYGLTNFKDKNDSLALITYSSTGISGLAASSVLNTQRISQVKSLSFGLEVRLSFTTTRVKPTTKGKTKDKVQKPVDSTVNNDEAEITERSVVFGLIDKTTIPETGKAQLDEVANFMKQHPDTRISLVGHTCDDVTQMENIKVGAARAKAVAHYLRTKGIHGSRMDVSFAKEKDPVLPYPNANYQNRRVVIIML